jgi:hypothetical protein
MSSIRAGRSRSASPPGYMCSSPPPRPDLQVQSFGMSSDIAELLQEGMDELDPRLYHFLEEEEDGEAEELEAEVERRIEARLSDMLEEVTSRPHGTKHLSTATRVMIRVLHRYLTRENLPRSYGKIASFFQVTERQVGTAVTAETDRSVRSGRPTKVTPDLQGRIVAYVTESAENRRKTYAEVSFLP